MPGRSPQLSPETGTAVTAGAGGQPAGRLGFVVIVGPGQPDGQPVHGDFVLGMGVNELRELARQPGERDFLVAAPFGQFLDATVGEVHRDDLEG